MANLTDGQNIARMVTQLEEGGTLTSEDLKGLRRSLNTENRIYYTRLYCFLVGSTVVGIVALWLGMFEPSIKKHLEYGYLAISVGLLIWVFLFRSKVSTVLKRLRCLACSKEALRKDWEQILKTKKCRCGAVDHFNIM